LVISLTTRALLAWS